MTSATTLSAPKKYKGLAEALLLAFGSDRTLSWMARETRVSRTAVHLWLTGTCRPSKEKLGRLAALLELCPGELAALADYNQFEDLDEIQRAYEEWEARLDGKDRQKMEGRFWSLVRNKVREGNCPDLVPVLRKYFPEYSEIFDGVEKAPA